MKIRNCLTAVVSLTLLAGCVEDTERTESACPGVSVIDEGAEFCVHRANIIERGFRCPPERPHRYEEEEVVVCSAEPDAEPERIRRVAQEAGFNPSPDGALSPEPEQDAGLGDPEPAPDAAPEPQPEADAAVPEADAEVPQAPLPMIPADLPQRESRCIAVGDVLMLGPPAGLEDHPGTFQWSVSSSPAGSRAAPLESLSNPGMPQFGGPEDDPETPFALVHADRQGIYDLELNGVLRDRQGNVLFEGSIQRVRILAGLCDGVVIELTWDTPADDDQTDNSGTDMDLHLLNPRGSEWNNSPFDCHFGNPSPDWGEIGQIDDNCNMDIDDTNGAGPERILLPVVADTAALEAPYVVGVHYYRSESMVIDLGVSTANIRIIAGGEVALEASAVLEESGQWWIPAEIHNDGDGLRVVVRDTLHDEVPEPRP